MLPSKGRMLKAAYDLGQQAELDTVARNFFNNQSLDTLFSNSAVSQIINYTMGIAYAVFAICFLVGLFNLSVKNDHLSSQGVFSPLQFFIKASLVKILMDASPALFKSMMNGALQLFNYILQASTNISANAALEDAVFTKIGRSLNYVEAILSWLFTGLFSMVLLVMTIFVGLTFASLIIKIVIYYLVTPIGVATLVNEETSLAGKNFLRTLFSFAGELIVMGIIIALYTAIVNSTDSFFAFAQNNGSGATNNIVNILFNGRAYLEKHLNENDINGFLLPVSMLSKLFLSVLFIQLIKRAEPISKKLTGAN